MKKLVATMLVAVVASVFSPVVPQAHAAVIEDKLAQAAEQGVSASRIQELIKIKQGLENGDTSVVVNALTTIAQERIEKSNLNSVMANADAKQVMQTVLRKQVEQRVSEQLAPYQAQLNVLSQFVNGGSSVTPSTTQQNDPVIGAPNNYSRVLDMKATA
ncbi:MAG: hypothetical protein PHQ46_14005, partial [Negativicutes bacterium]|nr:hypothetical protein [Negativicutes bacterium]